MQKAANSSWPRRAIQVCGTVVAVFIFGFVLAGVAAEAQQMWREGASAFLADAGLRAGVGLLVAILSSAPYVLLARATRQPGPPVFFAVIGILTFACQLWLTINALFLGRTSTAPIAIFFIPLYLCVPTVAVWGLAWMVRRGQHSRPTR